jgi:hypothetical protein
VDTSSEDQSVASSPTFLYEDSKHEDEDQTEAQKNKATKQTFRRKFRNSDLTTCWLNSCLQLVLIAMDHSGSNESLTSELGMELKRLQNNRDHSLDSTGIKHILVTTEDTRIATRISEMVLEVDGPYELEHRTQKNENMRLNLLNGQQCVRDFFLCLNENFVSWPDLFLRFGFKITHSTKCCTCSQVNQSETTQMYLELQVPPDCSNLNEYIENYLNSSSAVGAYCENQCKKLVQSEKRSTLTTAGETEFIIVILTRAIETLDGFQLNRNRIKATDDVFIR